jgi:hypothetical protein
MNKTMIVAAAAALAGAGSAAQAQQQLDLAANRPVSGELQASDPRGSEEASRHDDYRVQLRAGERVRISLDSEAFDPIVQVFRAGAMDEPVAENDDSGESLNSRLSFAAPADGAYVVRVLSFDPAQTGAYTLRAEPLPPLPAPVTAHGGTATTTWRVFQGELSSADPDNDGLHFDDYQISLRQGEQVIVRVDSTAFDPMVQILTASGRSGPGMETDDDTGPGTNALLGFEADEAGNFIVRVTSFGSGQTGAYTLRVGN